MGHRRIAARPFAVLAAVGSLLATAGACHDTRAPATPPTLPTASASASVVSTTPEPPTGSAARRCGSGTMTVTHTPAGPLERRACAHTGTRIRIDLEPSTDHDWTPIASSDPAVASVVADRAASGGTRTAEIRADSPGTAELISADTYTPDPHGPPSRRWRLTLTVVP
ncbi:hypothetical protein [Streptomyces beihaiensis]|uniref:Lipoprotein n=1 Tax=Streptomyces beihaiensis TaxID=2984495 RepID=A0ABT3TWW5_9ACTN|nr:hypothetical protein [Streptomyces beihaiensis]MCX3060550.1 hypothetical protein [Streptomyces beihaiensis]